MADKFRVEMANREEKPIEVDKEPVITIETASPDRLSWLESRINEIDRLTLQNFELEREFAAGLQRRIVKLEIESAQADVTDRSFTRVHERIGAIEKESADNAKGVSDALRRLVQIEEQVAKDGANIEKLCKAFDLLLTEYRDKVDDIDRCQIGILNRIRVLENWTQKNNPGVVLSRVVELEGAVEKIRSPWQGIAKEAQQNRDTLLRVEREIRERIAALEGAVKKLEREISGTGERPTREYWDNPDYIEEMKRIYPGAHIVPNPEITEDPNAHLSLRYIVQERFERISEDLRFAVGELEKLHMDADNKRGTLVRIAQDTEDINRRTSMISANVAKLVEKTEDDHAGDADQQR